MNEGYDMTSLTGVLESAPFWAPWLLVFVLAFLLVYLYLGGKIDKKQVHNLLDGIYDWLKDNDDIRELKDESWDKMNVKVLDKIRGTPAEAAWDEWFGDDGDEEEDDDDEEVDGSEDDEGSESGNDDETEEDIGGDGKEEDGGGEEKASDLVDEVEDEGKEELPVTDVEVKKVDEEADGL